MSCFHLFWLENAGWRGAGLGAAAVFWEGEAGGKPAAREREGKEEELEGKEFGCSFLISSSIETAST